jgi:ankyrin repeat protein
VKRLLKLDKSLIDATDKDGSTPLHCAAWKGHAEVVYPMLDSGANINAKSQNEHYGDTPLQKSEREKQDRPHTTG